MSAFVGRDAERNLLDAALAQAVGGAGHCVLVSGEAGIGKSRLIAEARRRAAQRGFLILEASCAAQDSAAALAPLRPLLASCGLALPAADGGLAPGAWLQTLICHLEQCAATQPLLLTLEDIHWSDDATRAFLARFLPRLPAHASLLLLSVRTPVSDLSLDDLLRQFGALPETTALTLGPLTRSQVAKVMRGEAGASWPDRFYFLQKVYEVTGGNPLFVEEICLSSTATESVSPQTDLLGLQPLPQVAVPRSVRRIIRQRVRHVSHLAQKVADLCAIQGRAFDLPLLAAATGLSQAMLNALCRELAAENLAIQSASGAFTFRHAMVREALYDRLLIRERRALHAALLGAIEDVYAGSLQQRLGDLTYHAYAAAQWERTARYARQAAEQALAYGAPRAAAAQYKRAIEAAGHLFRIPSWDLHCSRAGALQQLGDIDGALTEYATALDGARMARNEQAERIVVNKLAGLLPSLPQAHASDYYLHIAGDIEGSQ